jgi:hypothetical protein
LEALESLGDWLYYDRCRPKCGWNLVGAFSGHMKLSFQAARSIG